VRRHSRRGPAARRGGDVRCRRGSRAGAKGVGGVRRRGRSLRPERRPGSLRHARDVLGAHSLERDTRGKCAAGIGARHQVGELPDGALADPRPGALEQRDQVLRQRRRLDHGAARALGDQHVALRAVGPQRRVLAAVPAPHLPVRVVVELADRHQPVAVAVGVAAAQAVDDHAREHGGDAVAVDLAALERVLGPARGGQDDPAATLEALAQRQPALALGALRERPAVAAVEHEDLAPAAAVLELLVEPGGRDRGRGQQRAVRVGRGVVEPAAIVEHPVAGEVDEREVARRALGAEARDPPAQHVGRRVERGLDGEPADLVVPEHLREPGRVAAGRPQEGEGRVGIAARRDHERDAAPTAGLSRRRHGGRPRGRRAAAVRPRTPR
jgi:hypothetical protein